MSAVFCMPLAIKYETSSTLSEAPPKNLENDEPGMVWRSVGTSGYVVFKLPSSPFDTIALVGSNQRATDSWRVRMGATLAELNGVTPFDETYAAWSGVPPIGDAISFALLDDPVTYQYIRIDFNSPGHPDGHIEVCRLVVGMRVMNEGIDIGHEEVFDDRSSISEGTGFTTIERYNVRQQHKISISHIRELDYYTHWRPFLAAVGQSKFFLYMERTDDPYQQQKTFYVRNSTSPKRLNLSYDQQQLELGVTTYK